MINTKRLEYEIGQCGITMPTQVRKRDGSIVALDVSRISKAVQNCFDSVESKAGIYADDIAESVVRVVSARATGIPSVEDVQDAVETVLLSNGLYAEAKKYILYRDSHAKARADQEKMAVPDDIVKQFDHDKTYFPTAAQQFMFYDKYSRFDWELGRRETWQETVQRSVDFLRELSENKLSASVYHDIYEAILNMEVTPSMRLLATAGPTARRNNLAIYNCSAMGIEDVESFVECLILSMNGCGVGVSVEREYVEKFPRIKRQRRNQIVETHVVEDSTEGWAEALRVGLNKWWSGEDVEFDYSQVRPYGSVLKTKGGRSSGPEPLRAMLDFTRTKVLSRQGQFLRSLDAHDIVCHVGNAAVAGGTRRTAIISLFDRDDQLMASCKNVDLEANPQRWNANNSAVWTDDIEDIDIIEQMTEMFRGKRGEPGIFSKANALRTKPKRRKGRPVLTNPCGEVNLRNRGLCNLSIAVARADDTEETLRRKVELATVIGVIQSMATYFPGLRDEWRKNAEEERLLGVDITGQADCPLLNKVDEEGATLRDRLLARSIEVAEECSSLLGINMPAAISVNKPSGNSSQLLDCASGIHARFAPYYIRRMRVSASNPIVKVLRDSGVPLSPENGQTEHDATTWVISFPMKAPEGAVLTRDRSAIEQCEFWLLNKEHWTEMNPSVTISYKEDEIVDIISWVVKHKDVIGGMSFLPFSDARYAQMPYEEISEEQYNEMVAEFPEIDYSKIYVYEKEDMTTASRELSCFAGSCEI